MAMSDINLTVMIVRTVGRKFSISCHGRDSSSRRLTFLCSTAIGSFLQTSEALSEMLTPVLLNSHSMFRPSSTLNVLLVRVHSQPVLKATTKIQIFRSFVAHVVVVAERS